MTTKFRKKPVVIDAIQLDDKARPSFVPRWWHDAVSVGAIFWSGNDYWTIQTKEGDMRAIAGDWIIRGTAGELYPCKPEIFATIYEPV